MHTEESAREKWCPFARVMARLTTEYVEERGSGRSPLEKTTVITSTNRLTFQNGDADPGCHCVVSDCMAWRGMWRKKVADRTYWDKEELASKPTAPGKDWERVGYCGLAGKPE